MCRCARLVRHACRQVRLKKDAVDTRQVDAQLVWVDKHGGVWLTGASGEDLPTPCVMGLNA